MEDRELLPQVDESAGLARESGALLLVNDRVDIALAAGTGVHLGEEDLPAGDARRILPPGAVIGVSTHDVGEAGRGFAGPSRDHVAVGPGLRRRDEEGPA